MPSPIVFFDIAGPDHERLKAFYEIVLGWDIDADHRTSVDVVAPIRGAIRCDPAEHRLYFGVSDVAETLSRVEAGGGRIDQPRFEVPGVVVLGLFRDPAGNPMGLVEMDGDAPKVP